MKDANSFKRMLDRYTGEGMVLKKNIIRASKTLSDLYQSCNTSQLLGITIYIQVVDRVNAILIPDPYLGVVLSRLDMVYRPEWYKNKNIL